MPATLHDTPATTETDQAKDTISRAAGSRSRILENLERFGLVAVFAVVVIAFSAARPSTFPTLANWQSIFVSQSVLAVASLAFLVPLIGGRFDISVGANLGMCSIACAAVMSHGGGLVLAIVVALALGTTVGLFNGIVVAYLGVSSLIATLGASTVIGGLVELYTNGVPIGNGISTVLTNLSVKNILDVPEIFVAALIVAGAVWYMQAQTPFGRRLTAVGVNATAARLVGIPLPRTVLRSFLLAGLLAGIAGVLAVSQQGNGNPQLGGVELILPALAATFLGATAFWPGRYNVPGAILGLLVVGTVISGLSLVGVAPWVQDVFDGLILIVAVAVSQAFRRQRTGEMAVGE